MSETNAFASLSSTLLARKGHAKPAMRPQGFHVHHEADPEALEDLGWNDMGQDGKSARVVALTPVQMIVPDQPPVPVQQQAEIAREFEQPAAPAPSEAPLSAKVFEVPLPAPVFPTPPLTVQQEPAVRAIAGSKPKAAFTLRLDAERHLRLRLVCAVTHRSAQQIVTIALDEFLARQPSNQTLTNPTGDRA